MGGDKDSLLENCSKCINIRLCSCMKTWIYSGVIGPHVYQRCQKIGTELEIQIESKWHKHKHNFLQTRPIIS